MLTDLYKCAAGIWVGDESRVAEGRGFEGERRRTIQTRTGVTEGRVRCSSLRHHPLPLLRVFYLSSPPRQSIDMADAASGSTERSVQVKLVLLGESSVAPSAFLGPRRACGACLPHTVGTPAACGLALWDVGCVLACGRGWC